MRFGERQCGEDARDSIALQRERGAARRECDEREGYDLAGVEQHVTGRQKEGKGGNLERHAAESNCPDHERQREQNCNRVDRARERKARTRREHERRKVVRRKRSGDDAARVLLVRRVQIDSMLARVKRFVAIRIGAAIERRTRTVEIGKIVELTPWKSVAKTHEIAKRSNREKRQRHDQHAA